MPYKLRCPEDFFQCRQCGDCCIGFGGTRVSRRDIENIAAYLQIPQEKLVNTYCRLDNAGCLQLAQKADGYCLFWNGLCTIHPVKPHMCKAWPFIESVLIDPENWRIMSGMCPGINPDVPQEQLKACVRRQLAALDGKPAIEKCEKQGDADK
ncbi:MAG: YkgJ family cysteine cluster protein [Desulfosalsimonadaceae bacterium]